MIFYECQMNCECSLNLGEKAERTWRTQLGELSEMLGEGFWGEQIRILVCRARKFCYDLLVVFDSFRELTATRLTSLLKKFFEAHKEFGINNIKLSHMNEITAERFKKKLTRAQHSDKFNFDFYAIRDELGLYALENETFKLTEKICSIKRLTLAAALEKTKFILAGDSFKEEFARIYSKQNARHFYGQPVHYKITTGSTYAAYALSNLLVATLYSNKRLVSRRVNYISNINENCYDEESFEKILENAAGGTVVIDLSGERVRSGQFAHAYEEVTEFIAEAVKRYQRNTLCIFIEMIARPGFAPQLISKLQNDLHIIELHEGTGDRDTALNYLKIMLEQPGRDKLDYSDAELLEAMGDKLTFNASDIFNAREKLFNSALKEKTYPAYREVDRVTVADEKTVGDAYTDFREMIGLTEQKALLEQIIAAHRVQKMRLDMNLDKQKAALHMCFTGNPGSAKTTVARLLAQILARDGVLKTGRFVECGRADLVGKYVGWTAKAVREKFNEARGGVLFIDEAYSLSDGEHATFGDEAINTIVQEMENYRDSLIVIFAGYPDKMKEFLDRNEGLRSRIAFHVDFPDYTVDELTEIFKLMARRRGFEIPDEVAVHCKKIFKRVAKQKNFGNGRFVRNLLEQAWLKQAQRLIKEHEGGEVTREDLTTFKLEDFDVNIDKTYSDKRKLGFLV